ncbi:hypothetical protein ACFFWD_21100 [Bradyrhizobium erythrophlei]|uniref:hypothetical protein n=1 Tax=Bradyrhizobium erythrophlei TaxID=1437360 RepID=UPI0035E930A4
MTAGLTIPVTSTTAEAFGATILEAPKAVPTGRNMLVRHPDQTRVEYVEHRDKHPADMLP